MIKRETEWVWSGFKSWSFISFYLPISTFWKQSYSLIAPVILEPKWEMYYFIFKFIITSFDFCSCCRVEVQPLTSRWHLNIGLFSGEATDAQMGVLVWLSSCQEIIICVLVQNQSLNAGSLLLSSLQSGKNKKSQTWTAWQRKINYISQ